MAWSGSRSRQEWTIIGRHWTEAALKVCQEYHDISWRCLSDGEWSQSLKVGNCPCFGRNICRLESTITKLSLLQTKILPQLMITWLRHGVQYRKRRSFGQVSPEVSFLLQQPRSGLARCAGQARSRRSQNDTPLLRTTYQILCHN